LHGGWSFLEKRSNCALVTAFQLGNKMARSLYYVSKTRLRARNVLVWVLKWVAVPGLEIIAPEDSLASPNQAEIEAAIIGIEVDIDKQ
jgi:hypothetical protein